MASRREIKESDEPEEDEAGEDEDEAQEADVEDERPARRKSARKPIGGGRTRMQRFKAWFRDVRLEIYTLFFVGGVILLVIGLAGYFAQSLLGSQMASWFRSLGGATPALLLGGLVAFGVPAYLLGGLMGKRREFLHLVRTRAKSDFVRNLDKIERLAFELGTKESDIVAAKKREFKIRH